MFILLYTKNCVYLSIMTFSAFFCLCDTLTDPWNVCMSMYLVWEAMKFVNSDMRFLQKCRFIFSCWLCYCVIKYVGTNTAGVAYHHVHGRRWS